MSLASLGIDAPDRAHYQPISYLDFSTLVDGIETRGTAVDFGSGAGRVVCLASAHFDRVIGVELSDLLCVTALQNISARNITNAEIECCDATKLPIPPDATTFFFINPFRGEIMQAVLANILQSVAGYPRHVNVVACGSPVDSEYFEQFQRVGGLREIRKVVLPTGCLGMIFTTK